MEKPTIKHENRSKETAPAAASGSQADGRSQADEQGAAQTKEIIRVSISEAAKLFGVNSQTIRRAIGKQEMTYVVVSGRYKINFESLLKWSQRKITIRNKSNQNGIGQYVSQWKISNTLYSPSSKSLKKNNPKNNSPRERGAAIG